MRYLDVFFLNLDFCLKDDAVYVTYRELLKYERRATTIAIRDRLDVLRVKSRKDYHNSYTVALDTQTNESQGKGIGWQESMVK